MTLFDLAFYSIMIRIKIYLSFSLIFLITNIFNANGQNADPILDFPIQLTLSHGIHDELVIYVTGDGGWNSFNQQLVQQLEQQGYGVVALNSRKYFWSVKSPEIFARDLEMLSNYYMKAWGKSGLIILGYSFGADVVSFLPSRVSYELQKKIKKIALISPSARTDFVIRLSDLVGETENLNRKYKVSTEIEHSTLPEVCSFGQEELKVLKNDLKSSKNLNIITLPGDHRYKNNFIILIKTLLNKF